MSETIWVRKFTRHSGSDVDTPADTDFMRNNFTDYFGQFIQQGNNRQIGTFDGLVTVFWNLSQGSQSTVILDTFAIADGAFVDQKTVPGDWFNPHLRLISVVTPKDKTSTWKLFIVGPDDVTATDRFLQVASWDNRVFRFYAFEQVQIPGGTQAWIYHGDSFGAFTDNESYDAAYLGPFNGHVNGALIMKERRPPWYHWLSGENPAFLSSIPKQVKDKLKNIPYLTRPGLSALNGASVRDAPKFQPLVENSIAKWYKTRLKADFVETSSKSPKESPGNVQRWMAHLLLTTTVNFATSTYNDSTHYAADMNLFYNFELLSDTDTDFGLGIDTSALTFQFTADAYNSALSRLRLSLLQEIRPGDSRSYPPTVPKVTFTMPILGGGKQTNSQDVRDFLVASPNNEGVPFVILQTSFEDAQGVRSLQSIGSLGDGFPQSLISDRVIRVILMLDFWNPVYSWRRGVLMQYVPQRTKITKDGIYDLEQHWVAAIRASSHANQPDSPEYQFLQMYDKAEDIESYRNRISNYLTTVSENLSDSEKLYEYMCLAEARRRIYRPIPLDEFGVQLPYALNLHENWPHIEMQEDGTTVTIPSRGIQFLKRWTDSLAGYDPRLIPVDGSSDTVTHIAASSRASRCPVGKQALSRRSQIQVTEPSNKATSRLASVEHPGVNQDFLPQNPTWNDNIADLFRKPYWVSHSEKVGSGWRNEMLSYSPPAPQRLHLDLWDKASVENNVVTIYHHLRSKSMPITKDITEYWPEEALEALRLWANQGFRSSNIDLIVSTNIIAPPTDPPATMRVRKDILNLTARELQTYREKLDYVLQVGDLTHDDGSQTKWQQLGFIHAEWCLHYQEATFLWHRAYLRYVEELIDFPIPFWNGFADATADTSSPYAGLPSIFLDNTYIDSSGQERPNPLRFALGPNGLNKSGNGKYVERYKELVLGPEDPDPEIKKLWTRKVGLFRKYHDQISAALAKPIFSEPGDPTGYPWDNLPAFTDEQPDELYPLFAKQYFDGLFEQAHDNYHGWVGPDMADNTYTAFDPIFLSYHANMDRIVDMYLTASPRGRQFTSNFPLQPFTEQATQVAYSDPRLWTYTTIGDMAKDTKAMQYMYAPTFLPDHKSLQKARTRLEPTGGRVVTLLHRSVAARMAHSTEEAAEGERTPYVVFLNVSCTKESYHVDVFVKYAASVDPHPVLNPDYIGPITRIGMGDGGDAMNGVRNISRCKKATVSRLLDASNFKEKLRTVGGVQIIVRELPSGRELAENEWKELPGFEPKLVWH